jgi:hypothetical protein
LELALEEHCLPTYLKRLQPRWSARTDVPGSGYRAVIVYLDKQFRRT